MTALTVFTVVIFALVVGALDESLFGAVLGGIVGFLLIRQKQFSDQLVALKKQLETLEFAPPKQPKQTAGTTEVPPEPIAAKTSAPEPAPIIEPEPVEANPDPAPQPLKHIATPQPKHQPQPETTTAQEPTLLEQGIQKLLTFCTTGNVIAKAGVLLLFIGVSFLIKLAAAHDLFPMEYRFISVAVGAIGLLVLGYRLRHRQAAFGLTIQGGAIGILYLTVFGAFRIYPMLSPVMALGFLVLLAILSTALAILQQARVLAFLGCLGGFVAPILASTGQGSHVGLFSFYLLLNLGIFAIAWFYRWRELTLLGFTFTWGIGLLWGSKYYAAHHFASVEPFLILNTLCYSLIPVLQAFRQPVRLKNYIDGTLVFGTPLVGFGLQAALVKDIPWGLAFSALGFAMYYIGLAYLLYRKLGRGMIDLIESFMAMATIFATVAIPLALDGQWSAGAWALEGAALIWLGVRQNRRLARATGSLLLLGAGALLFEDFDGSSPGLFLLNGQFFTLVIMALASFYSTWLLVKKSYRPYPFEPVSGWLIFIAGIVFWFSAGFSEIESHFGSLGEMHASQLFIVFSALAAAYCQRCWQIDRTAIISLALLPVMLLFVAIWFLSEGHLLTRGGQLTWPVTLASLYGVLWLLNLSKPMLINIWHGLSYLFIAFAVTLELLYGVDQLSVLGHDWSYAIVGLCLASFATICSWGDRKLPWPFAHHAVAYQVWTMLFLLASMGLWLLLGMQMAGKTAPLPYIPFLNPTELIQILMVATIGLIYQHCRHINGHPLQLEPILAIGTLATMLVWIAHGTLFRTLSHSLDIYYSSHQLWQSAAIQTSLAIFWSLMGWATMYFGAKQASRTLWFIGSGCLGLTVLKLFAVDLESSGTLLRVISFMGVGSLMLAIGYFSPLPPKQVRSDV